MEDINHQDNDTRMENNQDIDESSDIEDDIDHKYGGAHSPFLDDKVYQKLKQNDPGITTLHVSLTDLNCNNDEPFFNIIDWKENGDCIANNTHLKVIRITYMGSPADDGLQYILGEEGHNLPTRQQLQDFFSFIYRNSSIKRLIISQIEIDEFGGRLIEGLSGHPSLEQLHIIHLTLRGSSTLKKLNLIYNRRITSVGWQSLSTVLKHPNCKLAKLSLSSTCLNDKAADILGSALRGSSVKDLDISNNIISSSGWQTLLNQLSQASIEYLNFEGNKINDDGLAELLANIGMFKSLILSYNNSITPSGWRSFFNTLQTGGIKLVELNISDTLIESEDIQVVIGSLFSIRSTLRTLQMNDISHTFTSQRWRTLFTTLQDNNLDLVKLSLCSNQIDDEGIRLLTRLVTSMTSLSYLSLGDNTQVTPTGWQALSGYLQSPTCALTDLDLDDNNVDNDTLIAFSGALVHSKTLENLPFDECTDEADNYAITEKGWEAVSTLVCNKTSIMDTYNSNHTLNYVYYIPDDITSSYLKLNKNKDKAEVARQKILQTHFSTLDNLQGDLEMMPSAMAWIGRPAHIGWRGTNVSGLSLLYNLIRRLLDLFDPAAQKKSSTKRKREDQ